MCDEYFTSVQTGTGILGYSVGRTLFLHRRSAPSDSLYNSLKCKLIEYSNIIKRCFMTLAELGIHALFLPQ